MKASKMYCKTIKSLNEIRNPQRNELFIELMDRCKREASEGRWSFYHHLSGFDVSTATRVANLLTRLGYECFYEEGQTFQNTRIYVSWAKDSRNTL